MIRLPLTIRYCELSQHEPAAWLVPGSDATLWLEEWLRWGLPLAAFRVAIIPGWGALTIVPGGAAPLEMPRAVPLGRVGQRL